MDVLPHTRNHATPASPRLAVRPPAMGLRPGTWTTVLLLMAVSATAFGAARPPAPIFGGVLHARGPHGVYTEIRFGPHRLIAKVHEPHLCVLHAHLVHGDPHTSRYAIEPPQGGRFCNELAHGEIVIRPHSANEVKAEFRSPRMDWGGEFRRRMPTR